MYYTGTFFSLDILAGMQSLLILGRQPALGLAELESWCAADKIMPIGNNAVTVDIDPAELPFFRFGGSIKLTKVLTELPHADFKKAIEYINKTIPEHLQYIPEGKIKFGISVYGLRVQTNDINRATLHIKKTIKAAGRSVRVVPNNEPSLNSAQVLHNQLTSPVGMELVLVHNNGKTILAQTVAEQDIEAYAARDQKRPKRDAKVGMLPPKLAQIIINLSGNNFTRQQVTEAGLNTTQENSLASLATLLDPFCGTGVVLQEALLMGFNAYGTDLDKRMVEYSQANLEWLTSRQNVSGSYKVSAGDATTTTWEPFHGIAGETYLGRPFSAQPDPKVLQEVMQDVSFIHKKFLQNVARQTEPGFRMCIAVPAWKTSSGFKHLKTLDNLEELGYTRMEFVHAKAEDLIYHREGQVVARELVVLVRK